MSKGTVGGLKRVKKALVLSGLFRKMEVYSFLCNVSKHNNSASSSGVVSAYINHYHTAF